MCNHSSSTLDDSFAFVPLNPLHFGLNLPSTIEGAYQHHLSKTTGTIVSRKLEGSSTCREAHLTRMKRWKPVHMGKTQKRLILLVSRFSSVYVFAFAIVRCSLISNNGGAFTCGFATPLTLFGPTPAKFRPSHSRPLPQPFKLWLEDSPFFHRPRTIRRRFHFYPVVVVRFHGGADGGGWTCGGGWAPPCPFLYVDPHGPDTVRGMWIERDVRNPSTWNTKAQPCVGSRGLRRSLQTTWPRTPSIQPPNP